MGQVGRCLVGWDDVAKEKRKKERPEVGHGVGGGMEVKDDGKERVNMLLKNIWLF